MGSIENACRRFSAANPLAPPDRRYRLAKRYFRDGRIPSFHDDKATARISRFLHAREKAGYADDRMSLVREYSDLIAAFALHHGREQLWRPMIEAYLVAGANDEAIAGRLRVPSTAISSFRLAFYDIEHLRSSRHRMLHGVIGLIDAEGRGHFDPHRIWKFIGYFFNASALDELLLADYGARASSPEGITAWISQRLQSDLALKQLLAVHRVDIHDPKQTNSILRLLAVAGHKQRDADDRPLDRVEQLLNGLSSEMPWAFGEDAERLFAGTPIGEWDESAAELRDDDLQRLADGQDLGELNELKNKTMPPPRQRRPIGPETFGEGLNDKKN